MLCSIMEGKHKTAMITVKFYEDVEDRLLKFAVILTESEGRWVFCKHRSLMYFRNTGRILKYSRI